MIGDDVRAQINAKLAALGDTETAVVTALLAAGIKGDHSACGCPIARYIERTVPGLIRAAATPHNIGVVFEEDGRLIPVNITTPAPVADFVIGFDLGMYPPLVDGGEDR